MSRGRRLEDAQARLGSPDTAALDAIVDVYHTFEISAGGEVPSAARQRAQQLLHGIRADV